MINQCDRPNWAVAVELNNAASDMYNKQSTTASVAMSLYREAVSAVMDDLKTHTNHQGYLQNAETRLDLMTQTKLHPAAEPEPQQQNRFARHSLKQMLWHDVSSGDADAAPIRLTEAVHLLIFTGQSLKDYRASISATTLYNMGVIQLRQATAAASKQSSGYGETFEEEQGTLLASAGQLFNLSLSAAPVKCLEVAIKALINLGYIFYLRKSFAQAESCYKEGIVQLGRNKNSNTNNIMRVILWSNLARTLFVRNEDFSALEACQNVLHILGQTETRTYACRDEEELLFREQLAISMKFNMGKIYHDLQELKLAEDCFSEYVDSIIATHVGSQVQENPPSTTGDLLSGIVELLYVQCQQRQMQMQMQQHEASVEENLTDPRGEPLRLALQALRKTRSRGGHPSKIPKLLSRVGAMLYDFKNFEYAQPFFQELLSIEKYLLGPCHPALAVTLNNIGQTYQQLGLIDQALSYYMHALDLHTMSTEIRDVCRRDVTQIFPVVLYNIGVIQFQLDRPDRACMLFDEALACQEAISRSSGNTAERCLATMLLNVGAMKFESARPNEALVCFQKSLHILRKAVGSVHVSVANVLNNLGRIHEMRGEYDLSLAAYKEAVCIEKVIHGDYHPSVTLNLCKIARIAHETGELQVAIDIYEAALSRSQTFPQANLGPGVSPSSILWAMAIVYGEMGNLTAARAAAEASQHHDTQGMLSRYNLSAHTNYDALTFYAMLTAECHPCAAAA